MIAFVFPGQGSQFAGMGKNLVDNFPIARHVFEEADDALNFDLSALCFNGPDADLKLTANTQPAILTASVAALRVLELETGLQAGFAAGHSLGEFSALVCAGTLDFADAVRTVRRRGAFMQEAVPVGIGSMAAIMGLKDGAIDGICAQAAQGEVVSPANFNSPGQVVIAGHATAVDRAIELAKAAGAKRALPLPVSAPFHCALMKPAGDQLAEILSKIRFSPMRIPVISNVEALPNTDAARVMDLLVKQVCAPVRWAESVAKMVESGADRFVEIGPGKVLSGLIKRISKGVVTQNIQDVASLKKM